jgi:enoyl-CoA hydratase
MMLKYEIENNIGRITLSNPPYNVLLNPVFDDLTKLRNFLKNQKLKAVIIKGAGKHFCSGADLDKLKAQLDDPEAFQAAMDNGKALLNTITFSTVPVAAVIRGACLGAGLEIALACHFRIASENAMFGFPETTHGLIPGFSGTVAAQETIDRKALIDLILSGRMVGAKEALSLGLADKIYPTRELESAAVRYLESLVLNRPPYLIRAVMESIHNGIKLSRDKALQQETILFLKVARKSFSHKEALIPDQE